MLKRTLPMWLLPAAALGLLGCPNEELAPLEPCTVSGVVKDVATTGIDKVDVLFVIDNSASMAEEQENVAEQLPRLVTILATGDLNPDDGIQEAADFQPVSSLQLGVISTDMGTDGAFDGCEGLGDDGKLLDDAVGDDCPNDDPFGSRRYLTYSPETDEAEAAARAFGCVSALGTEGCGLEQQLEAMHKALAPSTDDDFIEGTGHGNPDGRNKGFLRDDAVLAVIQVSDEEDCSITKKGRDLFVYETDEPDFKYDGEPANLQGQTEGLNFRCAYEAGKERSKDRLRPISRYVDGLLGLKPENPDRVIYAAIVGIPQAAENMINNGVQDFAGILDMPEMQIYPGNMECTPAQMADPELAPLCGEPGIAIIHNSPLPRPSCTGPGGSASPARRFVEVAKGFQEKNLGKNAIVRSICNADFKSALDQILVKISDVLTGACLPRPLNPNNKGIVTCDVIEILPKGATEADCKKERGRVPLGESRTVETVDGSEERAACKVNQVPVVGDKLVPNPEPLPGVDPMVGWYYDDFSDEVKETCKNFDTQQRITTTEGADLAQDAAFKFECFQPVGGSIENSGKGAVGAPCEGGQTCKSDDDYKLICEETSNTCQIQCESDANCPKSWICDDSFEPKICNNPTCPSQQ